MKGGHFCTKFVDAKIHTKCKQKAKTKEDMRA